MKGLAENLQIPFADTRRRESAYDRRSPLTGDLSGVQIAHGGKPKFLTFPPRGSLGLVESPAEGLGWKGNDRTQIDLGLARELYGRHGDTYLSRVRQQLSDVMSSSITPESGLLLKRVESALERGESEVFEYGVESDVARTISRVIGEHGRAGLNAITTALNSALVGDEVGSEALRHLGGIDDQLTLDDRVRFLAHQLHTHASPRRRYAAAVALADTNASAAIKALEEAASRDSLEDLRKRFSRLLELLAS